MLVFRGVSSLSFHPCLWFKDIDVAAQRAAIVFGVHVEMLRTVGWKEANAFRPVTLHQEIILGKVTTEIANR